MVAPFEKREVVFPVLLSSLVVIKRIWRLERPDCVRWIVPAFLIERVDVVVSRGRQQLYRTKFPTNSFQPPPGEPDPIPIGLVTHVTSADQVVGAEPLRLDQVDELRERGLPVVLA